ncbi:MAG: DUF5685 family protein [Thermomicrobiales bacterium]
MFGMLSPAKHSSSYRSCYARCCQHHRRINGISALPWLSYEAVLLYESAVDAGAISRDALPRVRCCKLRSLPVLAEDREVGAFCAHVGSLLASIKVSDDIRDSGSLRSRILSWLYRQRFAATFRYFTRLDADFKRRVTGFIDEHLALEKTSSAISLDDYVRPTARAFGYVFSLMARLPHMQAHETLLHRLGEYVGAAIISFDCAVDRDRDHRRGDFNPLGDGPAPVQSALRFSNDQLDRARLLCETAFGAEALTVQTLQGVIERVGKIGQRLACPRCGVEAHRLLTNWGLAQRPGAVQLNSLFGLGGLVALATGLAGWLMSGPPPMEGPQVPIDPNTQNPPPLGVPPAGPNPNVPITSGTSNSAVDCGAADCGSCGEGTYCCLEGTGCALDGLDCSGCDVLSGCDGCSGCDCSC